MTRRTRRGAFVATVAAAALFAGTAAAAPRLEPPAQGNTLLGFYSWDPEGFAAVSGRQAAVRWRTVDWDPATGDGWRAAVTAAESGDWVLQASWSTERYDTGLGGPVEAISPGAVSRGAGDAAIVRAAAVLETSRVPVILRFEPEMNGYWHSYCAVSQTGRPRGADHSTQAFVAAWRRVRTIFRGGTRKTVNAALRKLGQPPLRVRTATRVGAPAVQFAFAPNVSANPVTALNGHLARAYFPGEAYVDWVGVDIYDNSADALEWPFDRRLLDAHYAAHSAKPFGFFEWGLTSGSDDAPFVDAIFSWVQAHARVGLMDWYDSARSRLADNPAAAAAYRRWASDPRFLSRWR